MGIPLQFTSFHSVAQEDSHNHKKLKLSIHTGQEKHCKYLNYFITSIFCIPRCFQHHFLSVAERLFSFAPFITAMVCG